MKLNGITALVTGGSSGIGLEIAQALKARGVDVILVGRNADRLAAAATTVGAHTLMADLSKAAEQEKLIAEVTARWPHLSLLVNNAGIQVNMPATGVGDNGQMAAFREEIDLNFTAPIALGFGLMPLLARQRQAAIVNISSGLAVAPKRTAPVYCATKAGLSLFSTALRYRCEDAAAHISVHDVIMDYVETPMTAGRPGKKLPADEAARQVVAGVEAGKPVIWVGKTKLLRVLDRIAPSLARRVLRNG